MSSPLVSIITVVYNGGESIEKTILSVINQTFKNYEYIIIDGASKDGTIDIIKKYKDYIKIWISESDKGIYDAMNKGVKLASGKYIYFLGSDDVFYNNNVLKEISSFLLHEDKVYYGNVIFEKRNIVYDGKFSKLKLVTRNISHQAIFYSRKIFKEYSFNLRYKIFADYELNLIIFSKSAFEFEYIPFIIAIFNDIGSSGSSISDIDFENERNIIIKNNYPFWIYFYRVLRTSLSYLIKK